MPHAQPDQPAQPTDDPTLEKLWIGASWYPEMWPADEWPKDIARMKELGFNVVRLFEFAWHRFEPAEGRYDFDWAVELLDQLAEVGIGVILGTPTAAPPAWLTDRYPEVLKVDNSGRRASHGQRKHASHISPTYRKLAAGIVGQMARHLGGHPSVIAWQIDNEMSGYDYSPAAAEAFARWLESKYGTIDELNRRWGLEFWSQAYGRFEQIPMPRSEVGSIEIPERHHPSLIIAIARFQNDEWTQYIDNQCRVIRQQSSETTPITTNMVHSAGMHWYQHNRVLEQVGYSLYRDAEHYRWNVLPYDRMRAEKPGRPYWLLETAPNWSGGGQIWNIHQASDGLTAIGHLTLALGGSMLLFWQWRQHWAGQEMQHGVHVSATGKWMPNYETWKKLAADFDRLGPWLSQHPPAPARLALMWSNEAAWAWSIDPISQDMRYPDRFRDDYHLPLVEGQYWRDIICPEADLSPYRVLLMPMMPMVPQSLRERLEAWVDSGGCLLLGPLTGYRTEEFTCHLHQEFGGLERLIGAELETAFSPMWTESRSTVDWPELFSGSLRTYGHVWKPTSGNAAAWYRQPAVDGRSQGYAHGGVAAIDHRCGRGRVITLGTRLATEDYMKVVAMLCKDTGIKPIMRADGGVVIAPRQSRASDGELPDGYAIVNLNLKPANIQLPEGSAFEDLLVEREIDRTPLAGALELGPLQAVLLRRGR